MADYDFRTLSPIDFEVLCRDLLNADLGLRLVSFAVGPDGGIDLRDPQEGAFTIAQCKHRPDAKKDALVTAASKEAARWNPTDMDSYLFVVSSDISPGAEVAISDALKPLPATPASVWHRGTLNGALDRQRDVERNHIKLWLSSAKALEKITAASQWQRSEELLQRVSERVRLYVHTPAYAEAMKVLEENHLVMISGAPGVGKSTLAEMILLSLWNDGWTVVNIASDIDEAWRQIRAEEDKMVFYYDDFLGQTSNVEIQKNEGSGVALLMDRIRNGNGNRLLVLTTREQVLRNAGHGDDDRVRRLSEDQSKLRIELSGITRRTKAEMLFNHLYFGFNDDPAAREILASDPRYRKVIDHQGFNPRVLESLTLRQKHDDIDSFYTAMLEALDHPEMIWAGSFQQLSMTAVRILFQLAISPHGYVDLDDLRSIVRPEDPRDWRPALKVLENTWIKLYVTSGSRTRIALFDPSRRDFLLDLLDDPVYFDSVLATVSSLGQIAYIYRLAGFLGTEGARTAEITRPGLRDCAEARLSDLEEIVLDLACNELAIAERAERAVRTKNERILAQPREERKESFDTEDFDLRITTMIHLSEFCFAMDIETPAAEELFRTEMDILVRLLESNKSPRAADLFTLAANLTSDESRQWAVGLAMPVIEAAFENIVDGEAVNEYMLLPDWFRRGVFHEKDKELLDAYFDGELDAIRQHNNRDEMLEWLETLEWRASELGFSVYTDSTREYIDEYASRESESRSFSYPKPLGNSERPASDDNLDDLFARLKS